MRRRSWAPLALPVVLLVAYAQPRAPLASDPQDEGSLRFSVDVELVVLQAVVRDRQGHHVSGLRQQNFQVLEDGVRQDIRLFRHEDVPVTLGLVVDHSGSMKSKLAEVIAAARSFVETSNREDEIFVVNFNEYVTLGLPSAIRFTNSSDELERALWKAPATGQTALYDAIATALEQSRAGSRDKKVLIVVSDGGDNASKNTLAQVVKLAQQSNAVIYTIGVFHPEDPDRNPGVLKRLAKASGGVAYFTGHLDEIVAIGGAIARDIRNHYTIGYFSTNTARNGSYRAIRVGASAMDQGKLFVRTRAGYVAGAR